MTRTALAAAALAVVLTGPAGASEIPGFERHGDGPEKVIVLHDWFGSAASWEPMRRWLDGERFTYAFLDARGYGSSRGLGGPYDAEQLGEDVAAVVDSLGWERFHLVGHSMNGHAALEILVDEAGAERERLKSVVAIAPAPPQGFVVDDETRAFFEAVPHDMEKTAAAIDSLTGGVLTPRFSQTLARQNIASSTEAAMRGYLKSLVLPPGFADRARRVKPDTPVLVVAGARDMAGMRPDDYRSSVSPLFPNATIRGVENAGHYLAHETPVLLATIVEDFLAEHAD